MNIFSDELIKGPEQPGTTFYVISLDDVERVYEGEGNIVLNYLIRTYGLGAFNTEDHIGSDFEGGDFVLCVTDGYDIEVEGEEVDPEEALDYFGFETLDREGFVYEGEVPDEIIKRYFSYYELSNVDIDEVILELLSAGHPIYAILKDAEEVDLFDPDKI